MGLVLVAVMPLLATLLAGPGPSIIAAHGAGNHDEVARQAGFAGAAGVASLITADDRAAAVAGIAAAPHVRDPWELFDELSARAGGWDRSLAAPAARVAAVIVATLDGDLAIRLELGDDVLADVEAAWRALAMRDDRWADVRVHALEVAARIAAVRVATADDAPGPGYDLPALMADPDPEVRRAAAELTPLPAPEAWRAPLARVVANDAEPAVAVAAAQALCAEIGPAPLGSAGDAQIAAVVAALGDDGAARLRTIFKGAIPSVPQGALVDAARCLAARGGKDDRAAVRTLASRAGRVRSWIARLERHKGRS